MIKKKETTINKPTNETKKKAKYEGTEECHTHRVDNINNKKKDLGEVIGKYLYLILHLTIFHQIMTSDRWVVVSPLVIFVDITKGLFLHLVVSPLHLSIDRILLVWMSSANLAKSVDLGGVIIRSMRYIQDN
ncbi:hypothetical protein QTP88_002571 [Uroleucon formosanum]